jgi:hypothetical protein
MKLNEKTSRMKRRKKRKKSSQTKIALSRQEGFEK